MRYMARTGVRPAARPRPRKPKGARSRPGVGRKRTGSALRAFTAWLLRTETIGLALVIAAIASVLFSLPGLPASPVLTDIVRLLGLGFLLLPALACGVGFTVWRRRAGLL